MNSCKFSLCIKGKKPIKTFKFSDKKQKILMKPNKMNLSWIKNLPIPIYCNRKDHLFKLHPKINLASKKIIMTGDKTRSIGFASLKKKISEKNLSKKSHYQTIIKDKLRSLPWPSESFANKLGEWSMTSIWLKERRIQCKQKLFQL